MYEFIKTIISAIQAWAKKEIKKGIANHSQSLPSNIATTDDIQVVKNQLSNRILDITVDWSNALQDATEEIQNSIPPNIATTDDVQTKMDITNPTGTGRVSMNGGTANGSNSYALGNGTTTQTQAQIVSGEFNVVDAVYKEKITQNHTTDIQDNTYYYFANSYNFDVKTGLFTLVNPVRMKAYNVTNQYMMREATSGNSIYYLKYVYNTITGSTGYKIYRMRCDVYSALADNDIRGKYVHIIGNGTADDARSNAHTLDWDGNAWYAGDVYVGGTNQDDGEILAKMSEVIPAPTTATVGQTIAVKAVNDNGKPTEWEAVDMASGGTAVTVTNVSESTADGGNNVVTFSDGKTLTVKNGSKGTQGDKGYSIYTGTVSKEADGIMVSSYQTPTGYAVLVGDMIITPDGDLYRITSMPSSTEIYVEQTGVNLKGANGYTPVKGTDYYTPTEIEEVIEEVILQMGGQPVFGKVDNDNNIIITAPLADGEYAMKYENADGSFVSICTISVNGGDVSVESGGSDEPVLVNLIETAKTHTALNTVFNGIGYKNGTYASSASPFYGTDANTVCTGCIPASVDSVFYIKGVTLNSNSHVRFGFGKDNGNGVISNHCVKVISELSSYITVETLADNYYKVTFNKDYFTTTYPAIEYMYFSAVGTGDNLIVATTQIQ